MPIIVCSSCGVESKHHAKRMCKPCYRKSDLYKSLRSISDKKFQLENKEKIYEVRKKRRTSQEFKESDGYIKNLISINIGLSMKKISQYPYLIKTKKIELKIKTTIKKIKENEQ